MTVTPHKKVAIALQKELYAATKELLESGPSYQKYALMQDEIVERTIPLNWPKASAKCLQRISARLPAVNYLANKKQQTADAKRIEGLLLRVFLLVEPRKRKYHRPANSSPKKQN